MTLEAAVEEIIALRAALEVQKDVARFWRYACERAIKCWNAEEDNHDKTRDIARRACSYASAYIQACEDGMDEEEAAEDLETVREWIAELRRETPPPHATDEDPDA